MKYYLILVFAIFSLKAFAQQKQFSSDDSGKFIYYEVVETSTGKDSLMLRANAFVDAYKKTIRKLSNTDTSIIAKGITVIDKTILVASHPSGEVSYNMTFEAREKNTGSG